MEWSTKHDILLLKEILVSEPHKFRKSSNERGRIWTLIASNLNKIDEVKFWVKQYIGRPIVSYANCCNCCKGSNATSILASCLFPSKTWSKFTYFRKILDAQLYKLRGTNNNSKKEYACFITFSRTISRSGLNVMQIRRAPKGIISNDRQLCTMYERERHN